jgi:hypothetical protein
MSYLPIQHEQKTLVKFELAGERVVERFSLTPGQNMSMTSGIRSVIEVESLDSQVKKEETIHYV